MADERALEAQLRDLRKAHDALDRAASFAFRWPEEEFNQRIFALALRVREAAEAVALACLPKD